MNSFNTPHVDAMEFTFPPRLNKQKDGEIILLNSKAIIGIWKKILLEHNGALEPLADKWKEDISWWIFNKWKKVCNSFGLSCMVETCPDRQILQTLRMQATFQSTRIQFSPEMTTMSEICNIGMCQSAILAL